MFILLTYCTWNKENYHKMASYQQILTNTGILVRNQESMVVPEMVFAWRCADSPSHLSSREPKRGTQLEIQAKPKSCATQCGTWNPQSSNTPTPYPEGGRQVCVKPLLWIWGCKHVLLCRWWRSPPQPLSFFLSVSALFFSTKSKQQSAPVTQSKEIKNTLKYLASKHAECSLLKLLFKYNNICVYISYVCIYV